MGDFGFENIEPSSISYILFSDLEARRSIVMWVKSSGTGWDQYLLIIYSLRRWVGCVPTLVVIFDRDGENFGPMKVIFEIPRQCRESSEILYNRYCSPVPSM